MTLSDEELQPIKYSPAILAENDSIVRAEIPADLKYGMKKVLSKLEKTFTPELSIRGGAAMSEVFTSRRCWRKGERMTENSVRFGEGLQKLSDDVLVTAVNPVLGWWFLHMAGPNGDRKERVLAALANDGCQLDACCRLLAEVHVAERSSDRDRPPFRPGDRGGQRDIHRGRQNGKGLGASSHSAPGHGRGHVRGVAVVSHGSPAERATRTRIMARMLTPYLQLRPGGVGRPRRGHRERAV